MSTKTYNRLRYITQIVLPAVATFMVTIGGAWNSEVVISIATTISAVVTLLSGILGASSAIYDKEGGKENGENMGIINSCGTDDLFRYVHVSDCSSREQG